MYFRLTWKYFIRFSLPAMPLFVAVTIMLNEPVLPGVLPGPVKFSYCFSLVLVFYRMTNDYPFII
jgi:hypothetical protein